MRIPAYLYVSRHGLYYFRCPIDPATHPARNRSSIRISLRTRDPERAVQLAQRLRYTALMLINVGRTCRVEYPAIRDMLRTYFGRMLEAQKKDIREDGHLTPLMVHSFRAMVQEAENPSDVSFKSLRANASVDNFSIDEILRSFGLPTAITPEARATLLNEYRREDLRYTRAVLAFDSADDAEHTVPVPSGKPKSEPSAATTSLKELVSEFWKYQKLEERWIAKTEGEKQEHIDLLYEVLGKDTDIRAIGRNEARSMRSILVAYPVNRNKLPHTKGKTLEELSRIGGLRTLHALTINKYLQTYTGLFNWSKLNGYSADNPFAGLSVRKDKSRGEAPRLPFSSTDMNVIKLAALDPERKAQDHHKWGVLIAMHSGARLNEVAQLHLADLELRDGIWCFNINGDGPTKKLKNRASRRIVPVHPQLIELGLLDYMTRMRNRTGNTRLFPQLSYTKSDGYGRNLGRWFNETLLPDLSIKTKQLTFHSLRHTVVELLIAAEVSQEHIMAIVGHEPGTTTLSTYNRNGFPANQLLSAIEKIL